MAYHINYGKWVKRSEWQIEQMAYQIHYAMFKLDALEQIDNYF